MSSLCLVSLVSKRWKAIRLQPCLVQVENFVGPSLLPATLTESLRHGMSQTAQASLTQG